MEKYRIFRSLDKPSVFFGIKGRYCVWALMAIGVAGCFALIVGSSTSSFLGFVLFLVSLVVIYFTILSLQNRITDRQMSKIMASKMRARFIKTPAMGVKSLFGFYN